MKSAREREEDIKMVRMDEGEFPNDSRSVPGLRTPEQTLGPDGFRGNKTHDWSKTNALLL
jgi:hypothetical protein